MTASLDTLLDFASFTHDIRAVKRSMWVKNEKVFENDSEHGYQLAMVAMYIIQAQDLELDIYKAMGMALVHDVLEVHAGDTPIFGTDEELLTKQDRERAAILQLRQQWPELQLMHDLIDEYELQRTAESKFVYALDKLLPVLTNYLDNGRNWKHGGRTIEDIKSAKAQKVSVDPVINRYYLQLITLLERHPELFKV